MRTPFCVFVGLVIACLSCGPNRGPAPVPPPVVYSISARDLYNSYSDESERWTGRRVRVTLRPGQFRSVGGRTHWYAERVAGVPSVVWDCPCPEDQIVVVTGMCSGRVSSPDGWYVFVTNSTMDPQKSPP